MHGHDRQGLELPEESVVVLDFALEGKVPRSGFEISYKLMWRRGGMVRVKTTRVKYRDEVEGVESVVTKTYTAPMPPEMLPGSLTTPSLLAHLAIEKHLNGMPLHRIEMSWARDGVTVDRGTMSRWLGRVGGALSGCRCDSPLVTTAQPPELVATPMRCALWALRGGRAKRRSEAAKPAAPAVAMAPTR